MAPPASPGPVAVTAALDHEYPAALRLVFGYLPDAAREARVATGLELIASGELDPAGLLVARGASDDLLGAQLCQTLPGAGGQVWTPQASATVHEPSTVIDALLAAAIGWLRGRGARFAQALLDNTGPPWPGPPGHHGLSAVTELWALRLDLAEAPIPLDPPSHFRLETYAAGDRDTFHQILLASYRDSQDVPELAEVRALPEILAAMQANGFDPARWWLARLDGRPAGVLVLHPDADAWEVAYLGVAPTERRRGCGRALLGLAIAEARAAGVPHLEIQVDERNEPARALYRAAGFWLYQRRRVYLAIWQ